MPRGARKRSKSGVYHIMHRGVNRQDIFFDNEDHQAFLFTLARVKKDTGFRLYGYCLMRNHIHLLLEEGLLPIESIIRRLGASYVYWYNRKYERVGSLFQGRFKSEPVEDDPYLLTVLRYIHNNPVAAGLGRTPADYKWSSYNDYFADYPAADLTDTAFILSLFHQERSRAKVLFQEFSRKKSQEQCLEDEAEKPAYLSDQDVHSLIKRRTSQDDPTTLKHADQEFRDSLIRELRKKGATIRQLVKVTGISKSIVERCR